MPIGRCGWSGREAVLSLWSGACEQCERKEPDIEARLERDSDAGLIAPGSICRRPKRFRKKREAAP